MKFEFRKSLISSALIIGALLAPMVVKADEMTLQQKLDIISKSKGQIGSGDQLRRFFYEDLEPIGIQPGGAGHVVLLYNKKHNETFAYCSAYDVVVALESGRITKFPPAEVK